MSGITKSSSNKPNQPIIIKTSSSTSAVEQSTDASKIKKGVKRPKSQDIFYIFDQHDYDPSSGYRSLVSQSTRCIPTGIGMVPASAIIKRNPANFLTKSARENVVVRSAGFVKDYEIITQTETAGVVTITPSAVTMSDLSRSCSSDSDTSQVTADTGFGSLDVSDASSNSSVTSLTKVSLGSAGTTPSTCHRGSNVTHVLINSSNKENNAPGKVTPKNSTASGTLLESYLKNNTAIVSAKTTGNCVNANTTVVKQKFAQGITTSTTPVVRRVYVIKHPKSTAANNNNRSITSSIPQIGVQQSSLLREQYQDVNNNLLKSKIPGSNNIPFTQISNHVPLTKVSNYVPLTQVSNYVPLTHLNNYVPFTQLSNRVPHTVSASQNNHAPHTITISAPTNHTLGHQVTKPAPHILTASTTHISVTQPHTETTHHITRTTPKISTIIPPAAIPVKLQPLMKPRIKTISSTGNDLTTKCIKTLKSSLPKIYLGHPFNDVKKSTARSDAGVNTVNASTSNNNLTTISLSSTGLTGLTGPMTTGFNGISPGVKDVMMQSSAELPFDWWDSSPETSFEEGTLDESLTNIQWLGNLSSNDITKRCVEGKILPTPEEIAEVNLRYGAACRPPFPYFVLIQMALKSRHDCCMSLGEICQWISDTFPYYQANVKIGWRNSVRHNLSLYHMFERLPTGNKSGVRSVWTCKEASKRRSRAAKNPYDFDRVISIENPETHCRSPVPICPISNGVPICPVFNKTPPPKGTSLLKPKARKGLIPILPHPAIPSPSVSPIISPKKKRRKIRRVSSAAGTTTNRIFPETPIPPPTLVSPWETPIYPVSYANNFLPSPVAPQECATSPLNVSFTGDTDMNLIYPYDLLPEPTSDAPLFPTRTSTPKSTLSPSNTDVIFPDNYKSETIADFDPEECDLLDGILSPLDMPNSPVIPGSHFSTSPLVPGSPDTIPPLVVSASSIIAGLHDAIPPVVVSGSPIIPSSHDVIPLVICASPIIPSSPDMLPPLIISTTPILATSPLLPTSPFIPASPFTPQNPNSKSVESPSWLSYVYGVAPKHDLSSSDSFLNIASHDENEMNVDNMSPSITSSNNLDAWNKFASTVLEMPALSPNDDTDEMPSLSPKYDSGFNDLFVDDPENPDILDSGIPYPDKIHDYASNSDPQFCKDEIPVIHIEVNDESIPDIKNELIPDIKNELNPKINNDFIPHIANELPIEHSNEYNYKYTDDLNNLQSHQSRYSLSNSHKRVSKSNELDSVTDSVFEAGVSQITDADSLNNFGKLLTQMAEEFDDLVPIESFLDGQLK